MGREWLFKSSRGGDGAASTTTAKQRPNGKTIKEREKNNSPSSGCMSAILNLFDIQHHHHFRFNHPSFLSESTIINHQQSNFLLQGVEAPRNSLESPKSDTNVVRSSSGVKQETNLNIPMGGIQIKTQRTKFTEDISSECSTSPGTKTPSLVARLMGLDLLPEYSSPRLSSSSTPARVSTGSRRSMENKDYHHRLSLQIDKENCTSCRGRQRSERLVNYRKDEDGSSQYANEIANQVRERISRRLGTDVTNTIPSSSSTGKNKEQRRDSNLVLLKPKKQVTSSLAPTTTTHVSVQAPMSSTKAKQDDFSSSKKLRLLDIKSDLNKPTSNSKPMKDEKMKRIPSERYDLRLKRSTLLPNHGVRKVKKTKKFLSLKKEMISPSSTTRLPQKKVSLVKLPSCLNSPYEANDINVTNTTCSVAKGGLFPADKNHFDYISRILNHCGINATTPVSSGQWYSPNNPLHPSVFNKLEKLHLSATTTDAMARRRMIFELVNEFLVEIVKPYMNQKPWICTRQYNTLENVFPPSSLTMRGSDLIEKLCKKINSFPTTVCDSLEDIDRLIEMDMRQSVLWSTAFATEEIVKEIENEIVETLIHEMATAITDRK